MAEPIDARMQALGSRIAAAREQLAKREDFEDDEVGDILETINEDFERVVHDDEAAAHAAYDRIEERLVKLQPLLRSCPADRSESTRTSAWRFLPIETLRPSATSSRGDERVGIGRAQHRC